jgi:NAD(P)-dependent dehydrogenase (short-subunit alcohol dehydrogenase family)
MRLKDKVAVVTGAASGMGQAIAMLYAREGAKVVVSDLLLESAAATVSAIEAAGGTALTVAADVADAAAVDQLIEATLGQYGRLDILVNNAGMMDHFVPLGELSDELWERVMAVNLTGPMRLIRKALPSFIAQGSGVVINVASIGGLNGSRAGAAYTASKHALIGLTKNVGYQYAKAGIRCNAIAPGGVNTRIMAGMVPNEAGMALAMSGSQANIRMGEAQEIATIALFLGSDESSLVNGTVITADAGWTAY